MAKVGRASRNASLMRIETITADKTIESAESGEVYLLGTANTAVTLPALKEGAYFKFIVSATIENHATLLRIVSPNGKMEGLATVEKTGGGTDTVLVHSTVASHLVFKVTSSASSSNGVFAGSTVEIYCDGTNWHVQANIAHKGTVTTAFAAS